MHANAVTWVHHIHALSQARANRCCIRFVRAWPYDPPPGVIQAHAYE